MRNRETDRVTVRHKQRQNTVRDGEKEPLREKETPKRATAREIIANKKNLSERERKTKRATVTAKEKQ